MLLLIDYREKWIWKFIQIQPQTDQVINVTVNGINVSLKVTNLIVGDFVITNDNNEVLLAMERKSVKDLSASIIDGRFREQKQRLIESFQDPHKILYVIEGRKTISVKGISKTIIDGSIQNLMMKHQFHVLHTEDENDTFDNLVLLYKKVVNRDFDFVSGSIKIDKCITKKSKTMQNIFAYQLSVIPGVSISVAKKIQQHYNSMKSLIQSFIECQSEPKEMLKDIQVSDKRKLGKVLSEKIYLALTEVT